MAEQQNNTNIQGDPLPVEDLYPFAVMDADAIISAIEWWETNATEDWQDVLEKEPVE